MNRARRWMGLAVLAAGITAGLAAKPNNNGGGGTSTVESYPPVEPAHNFEAFEDRPDLGGVLDSETNVVWGYSYYAITTAGATYGGSLSASDRYPACFAERAAYHQGWGEYYQNRALEEPDQAELYEAVAAEEFRTAQALVDAGAIATQYDNWRLPTLAEARSAIAKGLFTYGDEGLNMWTTHPANLEATSPQNGLHWTADYAGKRKGNDTGWAYSALDGSAVRTTGVCLEIMVRTNQP